MLTVMKDGEREREMDVEEREEATFSQVRSDPRDYHDRFQKRYLLRAVSGATRQSKGVDISKACSTTQRGTTR
jgi:hypothetical protein